MTIASLTPVQLYLIVGSVLALLVGYCLGRLRSKYQAKHAINTVTARLEQQVSESRQRLQDALASADDLGRQLEQQRSRTLEACQREEALEVHSQLQAQRLTNLEAEVASYEDQQIRLKRDFANYKSNKARELEMLRTNTGDWSETNQLPTLSKRIDTKDDPGTAADTGRASDKKRDDKLRRDQMQRDPAGLSQPLSRELEIPTLAESELPDSVDELEFELTELDETGAWPRG